MYAHFEKVVVKPGQRVKAGDFLGYEGRTGHASGCHLHYGLYSPFERGEIAIDRGVATRMKLPRAEIARVDPLLVLPERPKPILISVPGPTSTRVP
jgi:murein DD-endopeptidase MepM/ murein hydrolase activator NlpD